MKGWLIVAGVFSAALAGLVAMFGFTHHGAGLPLEYYLDMKFQPRLRGQSESRYFADRRAIRVPIAGTVPFGGNDYLASAGAPRLNPELLQADDVLYRGKSGGKWAIDLPAPMDAALIERGENRFNIHCAVCHGRTAGGKGVTTQHGFVGVANLLQEKYRAMPVGEIFNTITNGKGLMAGYGRQVRPADRWAIVAWLRVLQRAADARLADVPEPYRSELEAKR